jgi:hypothetical protein
MKTKTKLLLIYPAVVLLIVIPIVYGSEIAVLNYTTIDDVQSETCYGIGYIDGKDNPFDKVMLDRCGDAYYRGFIDGCVAANNTVEICDQATGRL